MSRSFVLDDAIVLAGHLLLQNYYNGGFTLHPDVSERLNKLLRPFADKDGRLTPVLGLKERIAELEASFPEAARAAHLTRLPPVPC